MWKEFLFAGSVSMSVGAGILAIGGPDSVDVKLLAVVGAVSFGDLTRRVLLERARGRRDPTDFWMSLAFAMILLGGAWDLGRGPPAGLSLPSVAFVRAAGVALIAGGLVLRYRAARALGANFLMHLGVRDGHELVVSGPYRWIRHPNYAALLGIALGTAAGLGSPIALLISAVVWLPIAFARMSREERLLLEAFGERYREYMARTWRIVPGIH